MKHNNIIVRGKSFIKEQTSRNHRVAKGTEFIHMIMQLSIIWFAVH